MSITHYLNIIFLYIITDVPYCNGKYPCVKQTCKIRIAFELNSVCHNGKYDKQKGD